MIHYFTLGKKMKEPSVSPREKTFYQNKATNNLSEMHCEKYQGGQMSFRKRSPEINLTQTPLPPNYRTTFMENVAQNVGYFCNEKTAQRSKIISIWSP
jgi:hypothetical protein